MKRKGEGACESNKILSSLKSSNNKKLMKKDRNNCYLLSDYLKYIWKGMTGYEYVEICYKTFQGNCFLLYFTELLAYCVNAIQWIDLETRAPSVFHILNNSGVIQGK